jgi:hypothetical protein
MLEMGEYFCYHLDSPSFEKSHPIFGENGIPEFVILCDGMTPFEMEN